MMDVSGVVMIALVVGSRFFGPLGHLANEAVSAQETGRTAHARFRARQACVARCEKHVAAARKTAILVVGLATVAPYAGPQLLTYLRALA